MKWEDTSVYVCLMFDYFDLLFLSLSEGLGEVSSRSRTVAG